MTVYHQRDEYRAEDWRQANATFGHAAEWFEWCRLCAIDTAREYDRPETGKQETEDRRTEPLEEWSERGAPSWQMQSSTTS